MKRTGIGAFVIALLVGCGGQEEPAAEPTRSPTAAAVTTTPGRAASPTPTLDQAAADALTAIRLCSDGLEGPDQKVLAAVRAARDGTRSASEVAASFQEAQNAVEALVAQVPSRFPRLAAGLQEYADTLGRARVRGDVGVPEITAAVERRNDACDSPA